MAVQAPRASRGGAGARSRGSPLLWARGPDWARTFRSGANDEGSPPTCDEAAKSYTKQKETSRDKARQKNMQTREARTHPVQSDFTSHQASSKKRSRWRAGLLTANHASNRIPSKQEDERQRRRRPRSPESRKATEVTNPSRRQSAQRASEEETPKARPPRKKQGEARGYKPPTQDNLPAGNRSWSGRASAEAGAWRPPNQKRRPAQEADPLTERSLQVGRGADHSGLEALTPDATQQETELPHPAAATRSSTPGKPAG